MKDWGSEDVDGAEDVDAIFEAGIMVYDLLGRVSRRHVGS